MGEKTCIIKDCGRKPITEDGMCYECFLSVQLKSRASVVNHFGPNARKAAERDVLGELIDVLRDVNMGGGCIHCEDNLACPSCNACNNPRCLYHLNSGHADDCRLASILSLAKGGEDG